MAGAGRGVTVPEARLQVQRVDGTLEYDAGTDAYALLVERARAALASLAKLDQGRMHSRHVCGLLVAAPAVRAGALETTSTVVAPTDAELGGAMLFLGLVALRKHSPGVFAHAMTRLRDAGLVTAGGV